MTTRYRVEYALKAHRRDALIEFIKGLLAVPFVLHCQPTSTNSPKSLENMATEAHRRYKEIMQDIEELVKDHIQCDNAGTPERSKLRFLVPSVGRFFTPLSLVKAFEIQDEKRAISSRRFVAPSFNDIRLILNTAQIISLASLDGPIKLITFDGDVTLYDDGQCLVPSNPVIGRIMWLLEHDLRIGIVTAAGYTDGAKYKERLLGLLDAIKDSTVLTEKQKHNLVVLGGESSYMFRSAPEHKDLLEFVPREEWALPEMKWEKEEVDALLDIAQASLLESVAAMNLPATLIRKEMAVGIIHSEGGKFPREQLEEAVLAAQKVLELSEVGRRLPFCAFNGGNDVFVDIGDKRLGVLCCQSFFGGLKGGQTLHIGDQFLSAGHNDFKARMAGTTVWVASPTETVACLAELRHHMETNHTKVAA
ncbi:IMP-specific 5-nucleotidase [Pyronema domesticum]|uniref:IMP-specific 5'-nucleotidase 1 n=1 Tax=Pyronema omphalodes (strain CBS 100304) TaxID=1076935 RepID=U4KW06_PYROM|nr:IMP-specific 5-nucleotidase [Pyronema domesticum]CCX05211.1 Similar to IMP-specific 5' acc. no. Q4W9B9 [Pyronema omphalodes CBS 100304]